MVTCYRLERGKCFLGYTDKRFSCKCQSGIENVGAPGGGIPQQSFILGIKLRPEVQLLTFLYIYFKRKLRHPSLKQYLPLTNGTPFKYLV